MFSNYKLQQYVTNEEIHPQKEKNVSNFFKFISAISLSFVDFTRKLSTNGYVAIMYPFLNYSL